MVMSMRPDANGASLNAVTNECFAAFGLAGVDEDQVDWTTCQFPRHSSCTGILAEDPTAQSGIYTIRSAGLPISVHCDMADNGWTLVKKTAVGPDADRANSIATDRLAGTDGALESLFSGSFSPKLALVMIN